MSLYDLLTKVDGNPIVVVIDEYGHKIFDGYPSRIGDADTMGFEEAKAFEVEFFVINSEAHNADMAVYGHYV